MCTLGRLSLELREAMNILEVIMVVVEVMIMDLILGPIMEISLIDHLQQCKEDTIISILCTREINVI